MLQGTTTLFHLPSSGVIPIYGANPSVTTGWANSPGLTRLPMIRKVVEYESTAKTDFTVTTGATISTYVVLQYISEPFPSPFQLGTWSGLQSVVSARVVSGTGTGQVAWSLRLMREDRSFYGISTPGDATAIRTITGALSTTQTRVVNDTTPITHNIVVGQGDRLVFELGINQSTASATTYAIRVGNPSGVADYALTNNLTTDLAPWVQMGFDFFYGDSLIGPRQ